jgi:AGZA family xanthine/uracil permease-like MFS transporter
MTVRPAVLERLFHLREAGTTICTELIAGATTFATLSYITFVQPAVLAGAGMDFGAVMAATCVASGFATALSAYFRRWNSVRLALPGGAGGASRFQ